MIKNLYFLGLTAVVVFYPPPSIANDFCRQISQLIATEGYDEIKAGWDSDMEAYETKIKFGFDDCVLSENLSRLSCRYRKIDKITAIDRHNKLVVQIEKCFDSQEVDVERKVGSDSKNFLGGPSTSIRVKSGGEAATIYVSATGSVRASRSNADEAWSTSFSIYHR